MRTRGRLAAVVAGAVVSAAACTSVGSSGPVAVDETPESVPPAGTQGDRVVVHPEPRCAAPPTVNDPMSSFEESGRPPDVDPSWRDAFDRIQAIGGWLEENPDLGIGVYRDDEAQVFAVVIDPDQADRLDEVARDLEERTTDQPIRVEPGCHALAALQGAEDEIPGVQPSHSQPIVTYIEPARSQVVLHIPDGDETQAYVDAVGERYGDLVFVLFDPIGLDDPPDGS